MCSSDLEAYQRALRRFAHDYEGAERELRSALAAGQHAACAGAERELRSALAAGQHAACAALAHRLRGAAANLGMEQLADALWRLERSLQAPDGRAELPALLELSVQRLSDALAAVWAHDAATRQRSTAAAADANAAAPAASLAEMDLEYVRALGDEMLQSLERGSFDQKEMAALAEALHGCVAGARLQALQRALDDFDFAAASSALQALLDECMDSQKDKP